MPAPTLETRQGLLSSYLIINLTISVNSKVIIIAEAGVNHNGDIKIAFQLIDAAKEAGADYVKFQTFIPELLVSKDALKADYQQQNTGNQGTQQEMLKKLALTYDQFDELFNYCKAVGIGFLSTGFDDKSIRFIDSLNVDFHKVPSGEITNLPYLRLIGSLGKRILLSTGMATLAEVKDAIRILCEQKVTKDQITVLQCTTEYPAPYNEVNLLAILSMRQALGVNTGFSDHTAGIEIPIAAVALGATVIEKHFTLNRQLPGPDHKASLEPDELAAMVKAIRNVELAMGTGIKSPSFSESKNIRAARRSIHISHDLSMGHILREQDLIMKRPGDGISPMLISKVIGKTTKLNLVKDTLLTWEHLK